MENTEIHIAYLDVHWGSIDRKLVCQSKTEEFDRLRLVMLLWH